MRSQAPLRAGMCSCEVACLQEAQGKGDSAVRKACTGVGAQRAKLLIRPQCSCVSCDSSWDGDPQDAGLAWSPFCPCCRKELMGSESRVEMRPSYS